jgi:hypothetical protein
MVLDIHTELFQNLHRTESMVSLCFRTLVNYITDDNLVGLQNFLENKRVQVDDRDEVKFFIYIVCMELFVLVINNVIIFFP